MKLIKFVSSCLALLLLTNWLVSYVYGFSDGVVGHKTVHIEVAEPCAAPSATVFGKAIGSVTPGDLFYIDATGNMRDIAVTLYLTNAHELTHCFRYLILEVGIYAENSPGEWGKAPWWNGKPVPDTFITLRTGPVSFTLAGYAKYKVTVGAGSYYCIGTNVNGGNFSPQFYLAVDEV